MEEQQQISTELQELQRKIEDVKRRQEAEKLQEQLREYLPKLSFKELRVKARLSNAELGRLAKIDPRTVASAQIRSRPIFDTVAQSLIDALNEHFIKNPNLVNDEQGLPQFRVPKKFSDVDGLVIYDPEIHRKNLGGRKSSVEQQ